MCRARNYAMPGFDALYKQTVTLFNRVRVKQSGGEVDYFIPRVLENVHLIIDHSATWNTFGGAQADNTRLHVRCTPSGNGVLIGGELTYCEPKEWKTLSDFNGMITFRYGNDTDFDFFVKGVYLPDSGKLVNEIPVGEGVMTHEAGFIDDSAFGKFGFYSYLNKMYDHVFAITQVSQYNLIPHFEIMAR